MLLAVLACIFSFRQYALIFLTTGGGPGRVTETLRPAPGRLDGGCGAAAATAALDPGSVGDP